MERHHAPAWLEMQLALWPDAQRTEQIASIEEYFAGKNPFITIALVAENDGIPVGFLELSLRQYAEGAESSPVPHIEAWFVAPPSRRAGVGRALMQAAEAWARGNGYGEITSDTNDSYPISPAAHQKLGFTEVERLICFRKSLNDQV
jgi:aminoglycoside 6'-N-acetyltransferase I